MSAFFNKFSSVITWILLIWFDNIATSPELIDPSLFTSPGRTVTSVILPELVSFAVWLEIKPVHVPFPFVNGEPSYFFINVLLVQVRAIGLIVRFPFII